MDEVPSGANKHLNVEAGPSAGGGKIRVASVGNSVFDKGEGPGDGDVSGRGVADDDLAGGGCR